MARNGFPVFSTQGDGALIRVRHCDLAELRALVRQGFAEWIRPGAESARDQKKGVKLVDYEKGRLGITATTISFRELQVNAGVIDPRDEEDREEIAAKMFHYATGVYPPLAVVPIPT